MDKPVVNQSNIRKADPVSMLKKNAMLIILVLVYIFFVFMTHGRMFKPTSFASLINQNAYVYILGCGMLMCMLTGGNIDLSCGAFVCLLGALGGMMMVIWGWSTGISLILMLVIGIAYGCLLGYLIKIAFAPLIVAIVFRKERTPAPTALVIVHLTTVNQVLDWLNLNICDSIDVEAFTLVVGALVVQHVINGVGHITIEAKPSRLAEIVVRRIVSCTVVHRKKWISAEHI